MSKRNEVVSKLEEENESLRKNIEKLQEESENKVANKNEKDRKDSNEELEELSELNEELYGKINELEVHIQNLI